MENSSSSPTLLLCLLVPQPSIHCCFLACKYTAHLILCVRPGFLGLPDLPSDPGELARSKIHHCQQTMEHTCANPGCQSYNRTTASSSFCSDCFCPLTPTSTHAMQTVPHDVAVPHDYGHDRQQRHPAAMQHSAASISSQLPNPLATRSDFLPANPRAVANWGSPQIVCAPISVLSNSTFHVMADLFLATAATDYPPANCKKH